MCGVLFKVHIGKYFFLLQILSPPSLSQLHKIIIAIFFLDQHLFIWMLLLTVGGLVGQGLLLPHSVFLRFLRFLTLLRFLGFHYNIVFIYERCKEKLSNRTILNTVSSIYSVKNFVLSKYTFKNFEDPKRVSFPY